MKSRWQYLMEQCGLWFVAGLLWAPLAVAQTAPPQQPSSGAAKPVVPAERGAVVVPPATDPGAVATPPKNVDPEINAANKPAGKKKIEKKSGRMKQHR